MSLLKLFNLDDFLLHCYRVYELRWTGFRSTWPRNLSPIFHGHCTTLDYGQPSMTSIVQRWASVTLPLAITVMLLTLRRVERALRHVYVRLACIRFENHIWNVTPLTVN